MGKPEADLGNNVHLRIRGKLFSSAITTIPEEMMMIARICP